MHELKKKIEKLLNRIESENKFNLEPPTSYVMFAAKELREAYEAVKDRL